MRAVGRMLLAATALWLGVAGPAAADVFDDNPATASRGSGEIYIFARSADGATLEKHLTSSGWSDWSSLGGNATSGPAAAVYGSEIHVFVRGIDGATYTRHLDSAGSWSGWASLGGYSTSAPSASWRRGSTNYLDLAVRGGDNAIWHQAFVPGRGWSGFVSIAGSLTSAPASISQSNEQLNIFARGTDGAVYQRGWTGSAWTDWFTLGGGILGAPAAVSRTLDVLNLYVRGAGNATYQRAWTPAGWSGWFLLDNTPIDSAPAAAGDGPGHEWVVARGGTGLMFKAWRAGSGWSAWTDLGPVAVPPPPPPPPPLPPPPPPDGEVSLETGVRCTPPGGRLRVSITIRKPKGKSKARVTKIVFYTKGKGRNVRVDRKAPFVVRIKINRPAGSTGRIYARVYYKRSKHGKIHRKTVSRRYTVCR